MEVWIQVFNRLRSIRNVSLVCVYFRRVALASIRSFVVSPLAVRNQEELVSLLTWLSLHCPHVTVLDIYNVTKLFHWWKYDVVAKHLPPRCHTLRLCLCPCPSETQVALLEALSIRGATRDDGNDDGDDGDERRIHALALDGLGKASLCPSAFHVFPRSLRVLRLDNFCGLDDIHFRLPSNLTELHVSLAGYHSFQRKNYARASARTASSPSYGIATTSRSSLFRASSSAMGRHRPRGGVPSTAPLRGLRYLRPHYLPRNLGTLVIDHVDTLERTAVSSIIFKLPKLQHLGLRGIHHAWLNDVMELAPDTLTHLDLSNSSLDARGLEKLSRAVRGNARLHTLRMAHCQQVHWRCIRHVPRSVVHLDVSHCTKLCSPDHSTSREDPDVFPPHLATLNAQHCDLDDQALQHIPLCIQQLNVRFNTRITCAWVAMLEAHVLLWLVDVSGTLGARERAGRMGAMDGDSEDAFMPIMRGDGETASFELASLGASPLFDLEGRERTSSVTKTVALLFHRARWKNAKEAELHGAIF